MTIHPACGTVQGHRFHLTAGQQPCAPCEDAAAVARLERSAAAMAWPGDRVKLSLLIDRRRELATLPLVGPSLAAGFTEGI